MSFGLNKIKVSGLPNSRDAYMSFPETTTANLGTPAGAAVAYDTTSNTWKEYNQDTAAWGALIAASGTADAVYNAGAWSVTVDANDVAFTLATGYNVIINSAASGTTAVGLEINDNTGGTFTDGILFTAANSIVDAIDASAASIDNAINIGANAIAGTNFNVSGAGAIVGVGVDYGSGSFVGTGDIAITTNKFTVTAASGNTAVAGTLDVTGVTTMTDLTVSGSFSYGGTLTVSDTLTVDELILDTDGAAPAASNCYVVRDNSGDLTLNAISNKQLCFAIAGTDEVTLSATVLDLNSNALDNCGYLILNTATAPAATEVYLVHDNSGDLTVNCKTGQTVNVAVAGTDEVVFAGTAHVVNDAGNDRDFRIETAGMAYAIYSDGGKDSLVLGGNTDVSATDHLIHVGRAARTATAATDYADFWIEPAGAVTVPAGVTAIVATAYFAEPNITATGTVTEAATVWVTGAPDEGGTANYAVCVAAGNVALRADDAELQFGASRDCGFLWSSADNSAHAAVLYLSDTNNALHICNAAEKATDWNLSAATDPTLYIHVDGANAATDYIALSHDDTDAHFNSVNATNVDLEIGGTAELRLTATGVNAMDNTVYGSTASHTADTADACLYLQSTSHSTKGFVCLANADLGFIIGSDGSVDRDGTVGTNSLHLFNGTAPVGALVNGVSIYSASGELYTMDAAGNATLNSPHTPEGDYIIHSYSIKKGKTLRVHLEQFVRAMVKKFPDELGTMVQEFEGMVHNADA
jgi:hypothetical protein